MFSQLRELHLRADKIRGVPGRLRGEVDLDALVANGLRLGRAVYVAPWCIIDPDFAHLISLGDEVRLGPRVHLLAHDASTRLPLGYTRVAEINICRRVFIGAGTLVLPGVTVGEEAVVGAASLVTKDVPAGVLAVGSPARVVGPVEEYLYRRAGEMEEEPHFEREYTALAGASLSKRVEMRTRLAGRQGWVR